MLLKFQDQFGTHLVAPLKIEPASDRSLRLVFAVETGMYCECKNVGASLDISLELAERAIQNAARAHEEIVDLTPEGIAEIKRRAAIPRPTGYVVK